MKYKNLACAMSDAFSKSNKIFLNCTNPVSQVQFDKGQFLPVHWVNP